MEVTLSPNDTNNDYDETSAPLPDASEKNDEIANHNNPENQNQHDDDEDVTEVLYHEGATPLFLAIEETEWRDALDIAEGFPEQVSTWVRSTGTANTTFKWSMWRRLPIHEACRRQAPAWLISSLLSAYPDSAYETTQFGELPLHLAVESGAAPEVVNLIIVANWHAIVAQDQSGRIPTEILDTMELLQIDDHRIVHESLTRCHKAYTSMQKAAHTEQSQLKRKHKSEFQALTSRHQHELTVEQEKQEGIRDEVKALESRIEDMKEVERAKDHAIKKYIREKDMWLDQIRSLGEMIETLKDALDEEKKNVEALMDTVEEKNEEISRRDGRIDMLSEDLRNVAMMHERNVMTSLVETERTMRAMVSNHISLQKNLSGQANGLQALLEARGISLPEEEKVVNPEETKSPNDEEALSPEEAAEAANAVVAAAVAALQKPGVAV